MSKKIKDAYEQIGIASGKSLAALNGTVSFRNSGGIAIGGADETDKLRGPKMSIAATHDLAMQLLGGVMQYDDDGNEIGLSPPLITAEQALALMKLDEK